MRIKHELNMKIHIALPRNDTKDILKYLIVGEMISLNAQPDSFGLLVCFIDFFQTWNNNPPKIV